ncbi:MAG: ComF family protein [Gammaproteobacteria bacterium]|nr:ComF family protein [Gammaproteobacteria bacterium]NNC96825.1 ComF family protein [Gammaproteobacteria bacterium]NNM12893.1 ComF family protein [Gammaproteobacteria bacterium]
MLLQDNEISEELCGACQQNPPPWEKAIATFVYAYPLDRLVIGLKYHGRLDYADTLAALMSQDLQYAYANNENIHKNGLPQALLPVPLHPIREFQRGYNQAHLLANALSRHLSVPVLPGLVHRVRHTPRQSLLSQEQRQKNLQKAFQVNHKIEIPEFVALIDDVMTTGATAEAVSKALISAGVKRVDVWCCARAE